MFAKSLLSRSQNLTKTVKRFFDLHEYQSKDIMRKYGILVQKGDIATTPEQAESVAKKLDPAGGLILKAQVHAGGRGKGNWSFKPGHLSSGLKGGVQIVKTPQEIRDFTKKMLGFNLVTHQTTKNGLKVDAVLIHEGVDIKRQIYLALVLDRNSQRPALMVSKNGGIYFLNSRHGYRRSR